MEAIIGIFSHEKWRKPFGEHDHQKENDEEKLPRLWTYSLPACSQKSLRPRRVRWFYVVRFLLSHQRNADAIADTSEAFNDDVVASIQALGDDHFSFIAGTDVDPATAGD
jgi:hypothetical protein